MLLRLLHPTLGILLALSVTGCATVPAAPHSEAGAKAPAQSGPVPPPPAPHENHPASIHGSEESSALLDHFTAFIVAVDGQPVGNGRKGWSQALPLAPGTRLLAVEFNRGSFFGRTEIYLEAKPGAVYELRQTNDAQVYGDNSFCEFWVVDLATGEKVTPAKRTGLVKLRTGG